MNTKRLTREEQRSRTRAALIDAAAALFTERGFQGASVEAIAARAGFTRGAFYSNFSSKEELFAELLQVRVYAVYKAIAQQSLGPERPSLSQLGDRLAAIQADPDGRWLFRLWFEVLAHSGRDEHLRGLAAAFWSGNRALSAAAISESYAASGIEPPAPPEHLASAMIALDIGLAVQHFVDPEGAPLGLYPELFELLFGPHAPPG